MYVPSAEPINEQGEINMSFTTDHDMGRVPMSGTHMPRNGGTNYGVVDHVSGSVGAARYEDGGAISAVNPIYQRLVNEKNKALPKRYRTSKHQPGRDDLMILRNATIYDDNSLSRTSGGFAGPYYDDTRATDSLVYRF